MFAGKSRSKRARSSQFAFTVPCLFTASSRSSFSGQHPYLRLRSSLTPNALQQRRTPQPFQVVCPAAKSTSHASQTSSSAPSCSVATVLKNVFMATTAAIAILVPRQAIAKQSVITITDQVPNFTLPSQEAAFRRDPSQQSILVKTLNGAKKVAPVVCVTGASIWALNAVYKRAQQQRLRDFQQQLRSSSYDGFASNSLFQQIADGDSTPASSPPLKQNRFKFRKRQDVGSGGPEMSEKVKLDIFQSKDGEETQKETSQAHPGIQDAVPNSALERAIDRFITSDFAGDASKKKSSVAGILEARKASGLSDGAFRSVAEAYLSRTISAKLDRAVASLSFDESESLRDLRMAVKVIDDAEYIDKSLKLNYIGIHRGSEAEKEDLYRRYAVHCFTDQEQLGEEIVRLQKLQNLLKIDQRRSEALLADVSKVMFQVAVSAAMMDGDGKDANMDSVKGLYESFGKLMDEESAESITSEVAVMRIMYALQMLLQQEGSLKDVEGFGKMCRELGVDIDELISRVGILEKTMGADATKFVDELREIVKAAAGEDLKDGDVGQKTPASE